MLYDALKLIQEELNTYMVQRLGLPADLAILGNVALLDQEDGDQLGDAVIISLVNIEEERALKNTRPVRKDSLSGNLEYEHPPVHLNLYLLFSANHTTYETALQFLSTVLEFFQARPLFTLTSSPNTSISDNLDDFTRNRLRLSFNLYTMTFEQLNHVWGALGGRQLPSALYRVALVEVREEQPLGGGRVVEEIMVEEQTV